MRGASKAARLFKSAAVTRASSAPVQPVSAALQREWLVALPLPLPASTRSVQLGPLGPPATLPPNSPPAAACVQWRAGCAWLPALPAASARHVRWRWARRAARWRSTTRAARRRVSVVADCSNAWVQGAASQSPASGSLPPAACVCSACCWCFLVLDGGAAMSAPTPRWACSRGGGP